MYKEEQKFENKEEKQETKVLEVEEVLEFERKDEQQEHQEIENFLEDQKIQEEKEFAEATDEDEEIGENEETVEDVVLTLDIENIRAAEAKPSSKARSRGSSFRIINTKQHGRRITLHKGLIDYLGTEDIEIGFTDTEMILAPAGTGISEEAFKVRPHGKSQHILYSTPLVVEATKFFELDFSNCTTNGLQTKETKLTGGVKAIVVGL